MGLAFTFLRIFYLLPFFRFVPETLFAIRLKKFRLYFHKGEYKQIGKASANAVMREFERELGSCNRNNPAEVLQDFKLARHDYIEN